ncbi:hypothetical protein ACFWA5_32600 [Streptomyces mirabilis]|uniref:hypothetical protein n=1 Tax=Streptomyces mirabilis TaxID=68239 RepID=UPI00364EE622
MTDHLPQPLVGLVRQGWDGSVGRGALAYEPQHIVQILDAGVIQAYNDVVGHGGNVSLAINAAGHLAPAEMWSFVWWSAARVGLCEQAAPDCLRHVSQHVRCQPGCPLAGGYFGS